MKIYCINLKRSVQRRQYMQSQFERLSLPFEFINAIDGRKLTDNDIVSVYNKWRTRFCHGRGLTRGEIGCALSHIEFYRRVMTDNVPGFVFEDDVELSLTTKRALDEVSMFLIDKKEPCIVQLPGLERDLPQSKNNSSDESFVKVYSAMGAYAYGVNPDAAKLLIKAFTPIKFPLDYYRYLIKYYRVSFYVYRKKTISVDMVSESTIGIDRFSVYKGIGLIFYKLWRLIGKTVDGIIRIMDA